VEYPNVIILAGPNGAGKTTISQKLLSATPKIPHFVNADTIARGLSAFHSEDLALKAGRIMLDHLHELADQREDFAFETTLASRTFAPWIAELKKTGYKFHLFFVYVPSAEVSIQRVKDRVRRGGHDIPEDTIRRRYQRGLENFFKLYKRA
jgi:predicted ABC-type ATPase